MSSKQHFSTKDIGAELLPIITRGLYRDPLDTLREYIQNAMDAKAQHIELTIGADVVTIRDDGSGMDGKTATKAIRFGMSDKNPKQDVGFRGIGIYSAFDLCGRLEIHTRPLRGKASIIVFDFDSIRSQLKNEEQRRLDGNPPSLYLEKLLSTCVWVEPDNDCALETQGTLVLLLGIKGAIQKRLTNRTEVKRYLESVVPLPFLSEFCFKDEIEAYFKKADYRVVDLTLTLEGKSERLYRPYHNGMFTNGHGIGPKCYRIQHTLAKGRLLGFAWVCLNDARKVLPVRELRGLLVKKFGFSVGGREQCVRFFARSVFNNRIVGEVIITHKDLLPNAARSDFEPSDTRDALYLALGLLAGDISTWADGIQSDLKAREELATISPEVFDIAKTIPASERDVPRLLELNSVLSLYANRLKTHARTLHRVDADLFRRTQLMLVQAQKQITEILSERGKSAGGRPRRIEEALKAQAAAPKTEELLLATEKPRNLIDAFATGDVQMGSEMRQSLRFLDNELRERLEEADYGDVLKALVNYFEEGL